MKIPKIQGETSIDDFFIFAACDQKYFDEFGKPFINSIKTNTPHQIHLHLYNPRPDQIEFCQKHISFTYETIGRENFIAAVEKIEKIPPHDPQYKIKYDRSQGLIKKINLTHLSEVMEKTYYASMRFVRLREILEFKNFPCLSVDIDAIVRRELPRLCQDGDLHMFYIANPRDASKNRYLAGAIYLSNSEYSRNFLKDYARNITQSLIADDIYWSLDQEILKSVMERYTYTPISKDYIDWDMTPSGRIWTAKGTRKNVSVFLEESAKYDI